MALKTSSPDDYGHTGANDSRERGPSDETRDGSALGTCDRLSVVVRATHLRKADITMHGDVLTITVRRGKVVPIIGPYVLSIASSHPLAMPLWSQCQKPECHLFLEEDSDEQRAAFAKRVQRALFLLNCGLEARSIRRGGLQSMAAMNWPLDRILQFSQHRSEQMLLRYLDYGRAASHRTTQLVTVAFTMGEALSVAMEATNSNPTTFSELSKAPTPRRNSA